MSLVVSWKSDQIGDDIYPGFNDWSLELLLKWHSEDPVSLKEVRRNEEVYKIQGNRNPYIDYPDLIEFVWGALKDQPLKEELLVDSYFLIEYSPFERWILRQQWINNIKTLLQKNE